MYTLNKIRLHSTTYKDFCGKLYINIKQHIETFHYVNKKS